MVKPTSEGTTRPEGEPLFGGAEQANRALEEARRQYKVRSTKALIDGLDGDAKDLAVSLMAGGEAPTFKGSGPVDQMLNEVGPMLAERMREARPEMKLNRYGMFRTHEKWPGTDEPAYFDATQVIINERGGMEAAGEMITAEEMRKRLAEREKVGVLAEIPVSVMGSDNKPEVPLVFDIESGEYREAK